MTAPRVTVLMPFHNAERFIREAVESILGQTFQDFELLAIDDGSTDASCVILKEYDDPRIRTLANPGNLGLIETLNRGVREAACELIARMDADDVSLPSRLEKQVAFMSHHPSVVLVGGFATVVDVRGRPFHEVTVPTDPGLLRRALIQRNCFVHTSVMFRRGPVLAAGGYRQAALHAEDYDLWLRLAADYDVANLPETLVRYRVHSGQISLRHVKAQRASANRARQGVLSAWNTRGWLPAQSSPIGGVWASLRGRTGSTGHDYMSWAVLYAKMGDAAQSSKLALRSVLSSPLSSDCWRVALDLALARVLSSKHRQALRWYAYRVRSLLTGGREP